MLGWFLPRETSFFDLFEEQGRLTAQSAEEFLKLATNGDELPSHIVTIRDLELKADIITQQSIEALHKTFLTPIERDDIFRLVSRMDDIVDYIDAAAQCIALYRLTAMTTEVGQIAEILVQITLELEKALSGLSNLKNADTIRSHCKRIKHLENDADELLHRAIGKLFDEEPLTRMVIKWKEVYDKLEGAINRCEDVAGIIEGVILEHG